MTRYDPFSYGQVPMKQNASSEAPDDLLFSAGEGTKLAPPANSDWELPAADRAPFSESSLTGDTVAFGADILGEVAPGQEAPGRARPQPARAAAPGGMKAPVSWDDDPPLAKRAPAAPTPAAAPAPAKSIAPAAPMSASPMPATAAPAKSMPVSGPATPRRSTLGTGPVRRPSTASMVVPIAIAGAGCCVASWLFLLQNNPVMGGIVAAASLMAATLARVAMRG